MKILLLGSVMFGKDFHPNPWVKIENFLKDNDAIIFNLDTKKNDGDQLVKLRSIVGSTKTIIVAHEQKETTNFLDSVGIQYNHSKTKPLITSRIVFFNTSKDDIDYYNIQPIIQQIIEYRSKHPNKIFIFSLKWGPALFKNKIPLKMQCFGKALIEAGINIVYGYGSHNLPHVSVQSYANGRIIYSLGDTINDDVQSDYYKTDDGIIYLVKFQNKSVVSELKQKIVRLTTVDYPKSYIPYPV